MSDQSNVDNTPAPDADHGGGVDENMTLDDFRDVQGIEPDAEEVTLRFDPFADVADADAVLQPPEDGAGAPAAQTVTEPVSAPAPEAVAPSQEVQTQLADVVSSLQAIAASHQPATSEVPTAEPTSDVPVPDYAYTVPDELVVAIRSDDPAEVKNGLGGLMQGLSQIIHRQVMTAAIEHVRSAVPELVQNRESTQQFQRNVFGDFYSEANYADLNRPELRPVVTTIAKPIMEAAIAGGHLTEQNFATNWPVVRKAIGDKVRAALQSSAPRVAPQTLGVQGQAGAGRGSASPTASIVPSVQSDIMATLFD